MSSRRTQIAVFKKQDASPLLGVRPDESFGETAFNGEKRDRCLAATVAEKYTVSKAALIG